MMTTMDAYDEVPYDCQPIPCTAPEQLALTSLLHGGPAPPVQGARLLEIGCGDGANLLSLAFHRPDSHFVGVDTSECQIEDARGSASRLGLANIELHAADIAEIGNELGTFDYILAHGVISWVSDAVRDAIFSFCGDRLAPSGLLYFSYNTYPGWLARGLVREVMRGSAAPQGSLRELAGKAIARGDVVRAALQEIDHPYADLMGKELSRVHGVSENYLIHEYLTEHNRPYWFREFASLAARFGFDYLAEAASTERDCRVPLEISECAASLESDPLEIEGLIDVLWYRQHRASLFCRRDEAGAKRTESLDPSRLYVASGLRPSSGTISLDPGVAESFTGYFEPDVCVEIDDSRSKAALLALAAQWPRGIAWERLPDRAEAILGEALVELPAVEGELDLWTALRELHAHGQVELRLVDLPEPPEPKEAPEASPLARWEAARRGIVTTATHHRLPLTQTDRMIVQLLDGRVSRTKLIATVAAGPRSGEIPDRRKDRPAAGEEPDPLSLEEWAEAQVERNLELLSAWGLLADCGGRSSIRR
jgi:SAM-dependent methyltransferase